MSRLLAILGVIMLAACSPDPRLAAVAHDPAGTDGAYPAALDAVRIPSAGVLMNGVLYVADGPGPHPTVILAHGFPGNERSFDLAHVLRRAGWNVLVFHYRGAWGSEGEYSFAHCVEDVAAALAWLRQPAVAAAHRVDAARVALVGHSLGGFAVLRVAAADTTIRWVASLSGVNMAVLAHGAANPAASAALARAWDDASGPLRGTSGAQLVAETLAHGDDWDLVHLAPALADRHVLLVAGSLDTDIPLAEHHAPLARALAGAGLTTAVLDADHAFSSRRVALARALLTWLPPAEPHTAPLRVRGP